MKLHGASVPALPATALAAFANAPLTFSAFTPGITEKSASFLKLSPSGKVRTKRAWIVLDVHWCSGARMRTDHGHGQDPVDLQQPVLVEGDAVIADDVELLRALALHAAAELYPEGDVRVRIDEWFAKSANLSRKISDWLLSSVEKPEPADASVLEILETAEKALQAGSHLAGDKLTAADVTLAASAAGYFFCVRYYLPDTCLDLRLPCSR